MMKKRILSLFVVGFFLLCLISPTFVSSVAEWNVEEGNKFSYVYTRELDYDHPDIDDCAQDFYQKYSLYSNIKITDFDEENITYTIDYNKFLSKIVYRREDNDKVKEDSTKEWFKGNFDENSDEYTDSYRLRFYGIYTIYEVNTFEEKMNSWEAYAKEYNDGYEEIIQETIEYYEDSRNYENVSVEGVRIYESYHYYIESTESYIKPGNYSIKYQYFRNFQFNARGILQEYEEESLYEIYDVVNNESEPFKSKEYKSLKQPEVLEIIAYKIPGYDWLFFLGFSSITIIAIVYLRNKP